MMSQSNPSAPKREPSAVTSNPVLRKTLLWSAVLTVVLAVAGAIVGALVAGTSGLWSAVAGIVLSAVFLAITAITILGANRWYGDPLYVPIFFGGVLGGWLLKFIIFFILLFMLRGLDWFDPQIFFVAVVVSIAFTLLIDVIVLSRTRLPYASDVKLPDAPDDDAPKQADAS